LITGRAGFIGSNFVLQLVAVSSRVTNIAPQAYSGNITNFEKLKDNPQHFFIFGESATPNRFIFCYQNASHASLFTLQAEKCLIEAHDYDFRSRPTFITEYRFDSAHGA